MLGCGLLMLGGRPGGAEQKRMSWRVIGERCWVGGWWCGLAVSGGVFWFLWGWRHADSVGGG